MLDLGSTDAVKQVWLGGQIGDYVDFQQGVDFPIVSFGVVRSFVVNRGGES